MNVKKRTIAVLACIVSLALVATGTFAWVLQQDVTKLNKFTWTGELDQKITVIIEEDFTPWVNKDIYITSEKESTESAIVRVRFEEFVKVTGGAQEVNESGVFKTAVLTDSRADSTVAPEAVSVVFSKQTITMRQWLSSSKPMEDASGNPYWVIDDDGWCYYTASLKPGEKSLLLLDNVLKDSTDKEFLPSVYGGNSVTMDYYMNIRVQTMSVDLSSYNLDEASEDYPRDWANENGCEITKYNNGYDITDTSKITDNADALVRAVSAAALAQ